jgi:predicted extracellular nuclease
MLTTVQTPLVVVEFFNLAQFGEIVVAPERLYQHTHTSAPSTEGFAAHQALLARNRLVLDDDNDDRNDATSGPNSNEPYAWPTRGLSLDDRFRGGSRIEQLTAVLDYSFGTWRMRPAAGQSYSFSDANPRTAAPEDVGGRLTVASFNVLNYFRTLDTTSSNSTGPCGPLKTMDCRGADSEAELERQRAKIVAALTAMDADVLGLIEIQNDDDVSLAHLVEGLNAATAPGTYDYVRTGPVGGDAIKVAFAYKPASVELVGGHAVLDSTVDPRFEDQRSRPALAQTFREKATGEAVTISVNHFKSKGSACGTADPDKLDGAGNCDLTRTRAAEALGDWLADDPTGSGDPDVLVVGDLNSYKREAPITALRDRGYTTSSSASAARRPTATCSTASWGTSTTPCRTRRSRRR